MKKLPELIKYLRPAKEEAENQRPSIKNDREADQPAVGTRQLIGWLLRLARPVLKPLYISGVARLLDQVFGIALIAFGVYRISDAVLKVTAGNALSSSYLSVSVGVMAALAFLKACFRYLEQFAGHYVAFKALEILRQEMFNR